MLTSTGKQSGESVESVLKKRRKAIVGRICRNERVRGDGMLIIIIIISINISSIKTVQDSIVNSYS